VEAELPVWPLSEHLVALLQLAHYSAIKERRQAMDTAMHALEQTADPKTDVAIRVVAWVSRGMHPADGWATRVTTRSRERGTEAHRPCSHPAVLHCLSTASQQQTGDEA
jgi:hypothetical protein